MNTVFAALCIALMVLSLMLVVLSLPGTWVILGLSGLWAAFKGGPGFTWQFFALMGGLAVLGEVVEFFSGHYGTKRFGGTNKGSLGGMVGAIAGAIFGAAFLFGFGALPGALLGGFAGSYLVEKGRGMESKAALRAAYGTTLGRFGGFMVKFGIGIGMVWLAAPKVWESV